MRVVDVNEYAPQFDKRSYDAVITENSPVGTLVAQVRLVFIMHISHIINDILCFFVKYSAILQSVLQQRSICRPLL